MLREVMIFQSFFDENGVVFIFRGGDAEYTGTAGFTRA